jgi:CubicO group peptidase (beta-lactamase class C family)
VEDLTDLIETWPVESAAVGVTGPAETLGLGGDPEWRTRIASVSKLLVGLCALVAVEEETIAVDEPAGPEGSTVEHLLAHTSGLAFDSDRMLAIPGRRRIYSNTGIEAFVDHLAQKAGMSFEDYLHIGVCEPLGMAATELRGSPAHAIHSHVADLLRFAREVMRPTLVSPTTMGDALQPHFPSLPGVLPGVGSYDPNPWGLTFEVRGGKRPHWTGDANSPRTVGHFGGAGTFFWFDPEVDLAVIALTNREFGPWALEAWPKFSDTVLERFGSGSKF